MEKIFSEKISGKDADRPQLKEMMDFAREGDVIIISDFSRLARNTADLLSITAQLDHKGVQLVSTKENIDTSTATGRLMLTMIGAISTFERECMLERQREGIAIAKAKGIYKGRKPVKIADFGVHYDRWKRREISKVGLAKELGIARQTLYNLCAEYEAGKCNDRL